MKARLVETSVSRHSTRPGRETNPGAGGGGGGKCKKGGEPKQTLDKPGAETDCKSQMPSGHGENKGILFWLVEFTGGPFPNKKGKVGTGQGERDD